MTSAPNEPIKLELTIPPEHPELLAGLEHWLQLGLISDVQVKRLARSHLTCPVPLAALASQPSFIGEDNDVLASPDRPRTRPATRPVAALAVKSPDRPPSPWITQILTAFMAELSVVWLLFLGVFMVVVSSAVLAASQWQSVSVVGQYAILWAYTVMFGWAGLWASQRSQLRLTGRMLQATTLLIIPINFWMIDGFNLWRSPSAGGFALIAALSLVGMMLKLSQQSWRGDVGNTIGLSLLQWGWAVPGWPLVATYVGTVGTAIVQIKRTDHRPAVADNAARLTDIGKLAIAGSTLLLVARATLAQGIPLSQLGLAIGICGSILCWENRQLSRPLLSQIGAGLLAFGWLITVSANQLWPALGISLIILGLLAERLQRLWLVVDIVAIGLVGLQTYALLPIVFPLGLRQSALRLLTQWANLPQGIGELTGLGFFPYLVIMLLFAAALRRKQQPSLALIVEQSALSLGIILLIPSLFNPLVRALYLTLAAMTLGVVWRQRSQVTWLIYLTHTTALAAVFAGIAGLWPDLSLRSWAGILLMGTMLEWGWCWWGQTRPWQLSSWYLGLALAAGSYPLWGESSYENLLWLITPLLLILLARREGFLPQRSASWFSVLALTLSPILTIGATLPLLINLAIATLLMMANTQRLQHLAAAVITVGFGLATLVMLAVQIWQPLPLVWLPAGGAIVLWLLWLLRHGCSRHPSRLAAVYTTAFDGWATALGGVNLLSLTVITIAATSSQMPLVWHQVGAIGLTTGAIAYRLIQQPTEFGLGGIAWGAELLAISAVYLAGGSWDDLAVAHLALGGGTQLGGDWVWRRSRLVSRHLIPPLYAMLGLACAHTHFTATTGLFTLAAAAISIGVGRRGANTQPLTYLGIVGISIAAYELLLYPMSRATSGAQGDALTLCAGLAALIAIAYQLLTPVLLPYWRITAAKIRLFSRLHWALGSGWALGAVLLPLSRAGGSGWMAVVTLLAADALWAGRRQPIAIYAGIGQGLAVLGYGLHRSLPEPLLMTWGAAIACLVAILLYQLPWQAGGWQAEPGQNSALVGPGLAVMLTGDRIGIAALLITGGFYAWSALKTQHIRWTYLSLVLADWAILRIFHQAAFTNPLWAMALVSGSIGYAVQVEPVLQGGDRKAIRHQLRSLAVGLFCLTALYQSDHNWLSGLLVIGFSLGLMIAGLGLRTRAYLYVGTLTFMIKVLWQIWAFISDYALLLWALGIVLGLLLIWVAATFESRRSQTIALLQYWLTELDQWE